MSDRALGALLLAASSLGFAYYTAWTLLLPFVEPDQPLHALFPPRHLAVALPAAAVAVRAQRIDWRTACVISLRHASALTRPAPRVWRARRSPARPWRMSARSCYWATARAPSRRVRMSLVCVASETRVLLCVSAVAHTPRG
jgi:hypothetical protein